MKRFHSHTFIVCMALGTKIISLFILTKISIQSNHLSAKPPCKKKKKKPPCPTRILWLTTTVCAFEGSENANGGALHGKQLYTRALHD